MKLLYGYEMSSSTDQIGHVVCPPLLSTKITVSSAGNTGRWIFYGTRLQIIDWIQEHGSITLENTLFVGGKTPDSSNVHSELIIDLMHIYDQEQSYADYIKSYFTSIYDVERVKVEIRPRIDSRDANISSLNRIIIANGTKFEDIVDDLKREWSKPEQSYVQQTVNLFTDAPTPNNILSAKPPTSINIASRTVEEDGLQPTATTTAPAAAEVDLSIPKPSC